MIDGGVGVGVEVGEEEKRGAVERAGVEGLGVAAVEGGGGGVTQIHKLFAFEVNDPVGAA